MEDIFQTVNTHAQASEQEAQNAEAQATESARLNRRKRNRSATLTFLSRLALALVLILGIWAAMAFDLMVPELALPLGALVIAWTTCWLGAWLQYIGKGLIK